MVKLKKMYDLLYPYQDENRIKIEDGFLRKYYIFTISNRPIAFYMNERFPIKVEGDTLIISKNDNLRFCNKFEQLVRANVEILEKIFEDRDKFIAKLNKAKNDGDVEEVIKNLFLLGRYGIEWYFPYLFLYEKLRNYFTEEEIEEITDIIRISDELPYYFKIWKGLEKVKMGEISLNDFIETYGFFGRKSLEKCEYENPEHLLRLLKQIRQKNEIEKMLALIEKRLDEKKLLMRWLRSKVDLETFILVDSFAKIDTENEIIRSERAKALKFLSDRKVKKERIEEIIKTLLQEGG